MNLIKVERINCKDEIEILETKNSLREVEHREKVEHKAVGLDIVAKMDEPKHAQYSAKVAEEAVVGAGRSSWNISKIDVTKLGQKSAEELVEKSGRTGLDILSKMDEPRHSQKSEKVAEEAVKKFDRPGLNIFAKMDKPKHVQKSEKVAEEEVKKFSRTDLDIFSKTDEPKHAQKHVTGKKETVEEHFSLVPIIQETISGWAEKESIQNQVVFRSIKSCKKENRRIKRSETGAKNKVMKKWIDGLIKEAVAEYEDDDFDKQECLYEF